MPPTCAADPLIESDEEGVRSLVRVLTTAGVRADRARAYAPRLLDALAEYEINTKLRVGHFLAQVLVESGNLRWMEELASGEAYEGRRSLGNTQPGDGKRFKGRGPLQVTGRANYRRLAEHLKARGVQTWDVVANPALVAGAHAFRAAGFWWESNRANAVADGGDDVRDVQRVSRLVNRGNANATKPANHEAERVAAFRTVMRAMNEEGIG